MEIVFYLGFIILILCWLIVLTIFAYTVRAYWRINKDFKQAFFFDEKVKGLTANQIARAKDECFRDMLLYGFDLVISLVAIVSTGYLVCVL